MPPDDLPGNLMDFRGSLIGGKIIYEPRSPNQQSLLRILCFLVILNQLRGIFGFENFLRLHWFLMGILSLSLPAGTKRNPVLNSCVDGVFGNQNRFQTLPASTGTCPIPLKQNPGLPKPTQTGLLKTVGAFKGARNGKVLFLRPPRPPQPERSFGPKRILPPFLLAPTFF